MVPISSQNMIAGQESDARPLLPTVLADIILDYLPDRELLPWIDESKLKWDTLSRNPAAIQYLQMYPDKIDWRYLSKNESAIHMLEANPDKIDWDRLSKNSGAVRILEANLDKVSIKKTIHIMNANSIIKNNIKKFYLSDLISHPTFFHECVDTTDEWFNEFSGISEESWMLNYNRGEAAFDLMYKINREISELMYSYPWVTKYISVDNINDNILIKNGQRISWEFLSINPAAIDILEANQDKINWHQLSYNPSAMNLLKNNQDKINWWRLSKNSGIFSPMPKSKIRRLL